MVMDPCDDSTLMSSLLSQSERHRRKAFLHVDTFFACCSIHTDLHASVWTMVWFTSRSSFLGNVVKYLVGPFSVEHGETHVVYQSVAFLGALLHPRRFLKM